MKFTHVYNTKEQAKKIGVDAKVLVKDACILVKDIAGLVPAIGRDIKAGSDLRKEFKAWKEQQSEPQEG